MTATPAMLRARARALAVIREFFAERGVLEVQTPVLGKATVTDPQVEAFELAPGYLQTSTEYHQKRLLAAGLGDNYTLGPVFRAGEQGRLHNPEFTMLEWYRLGFDDHALMAEVQALVDRLLGPGEYHTHRYLELVAGQTLSAEEQALPAHAHDDLKLARALEQLGSGRHFVTGYPAAAAVLARLDPADPTVACRFELVIDGLEVANGYFELTDESAHRERFAVDRQARSALGLAVPEPDEQFLAAIAQGLPECSGVAVGFDRLLMLQQQAASISEVLAFDWNER